MPKMIAKRPFRYAGRSLAAGEAFSATAIDSRVLAATGRAQIEVSASPEIQPPPRRRYKRRDMRAEG